MIPGGQNHQLLVGGRPPYGTDPCLAVVHPDSSFSSWHDHFLCTLYSNVQNHMVGEIVVKCDACTEFYKQKARLHFSFDQNKSCFAQKKTTVPFFNRIKHFRVYLGIKHLVTCSRGFSHSSHVYWFVAGSFQIGNRKCHLRNSSSGWHPHGDELLYVHCL